MKLLILDTETTGTEETTSVCEIAATLYQVGSTNRTTGAIASVSTLLLVPFNDAETINNITAELSVSTPESVLVGGLNYLKTLAHEADYYVAFNAEFDAHRLTPYINEKPWICAMQDIDWWYPHKTTNRKFRLIDIALKLGIGISTVHRAGDDVRLLVECFNRRVDVLPDMIEAAIDREINGFQAPHFRAALMML